MHSQHKAVDVNAHKGACCCMFARWVHMRFKLQSEAQSVTEEEVGEEEDEEDTEEVDGEDGLKGDSVWDPDHATPWRPRRSRRNTSQLTARQPSRMLREKV